MVGNYESLANDRALTTFPRPVWLLLGFLQIVLGLGLVLPGLIKKLSLLIPYSAGGLALIFLLGIVIYPDYAGFPGFLWAAIPASFLVFIAHKRLIESRNV